MIEVFATGIVRGQTIEIDQPVDVWEGRRVEVVFRPVEVLPGDGIRASAGSWAEGGEALDRWLAETYAMRDAPVRDVIPPV